MQRDFVGNFVGERFSEIETLAGSHPMRRILGRFVIAPSSKCCDIARKCLIIRNPSLRLMFNAPSDRDGDLPLVTLHFFKDFLKS